tara:strand:- start:27123 stop:27509 length:387 start_codon:yes stop_codon:yes gene_type:complete
MIKMGKDTAVSKSNGNLPNVKAAMATWFQKMVFGKVTQTTVNYETVEEIENFSFRGVMQPLKPEALKVKPEHQRSWVWQQLHSETVLPLTTDDTVIYESRRYRVMETPNYEKYGYIEYHLVEDVEVIE